MVRPLPPSLFTMADPRTQYLFAENEAPPPPQHEKGTLQQPIPSKSVQRSKTVSKVRGFFKKKDAADAATPRESRSYSNASQSSSHYATEYVQDHPKPPSIPMSLSDADVSISEDAQSERDSLPMTTGTTSVPPTTPGPIPGACLVAPSGAAPVQTQAPTTPIPTSSYEEDEAAQKAEIEKLQSDLVRIKIDIKRVQEETAEDQKQKKRLEKELEMAKEQIDGEKQTYTMIEAKLRQLEGEFRATDDDLSTIQAMFNQIKYTIQRDVMQLGKHANKEEAVKLFSEKWPSLKITAEIEPKRVNQFTEKLIYEHLKCRVLDSPIYPGLTVNSDFVVMSRWLSKHKSPITVRLRRQLAAFVAKSLENAQKMPLEEKSDVAKTMENEKKSIVDSVFTDLARIYTHDNDKLRKKIESFVDSALRLVLAIRGQKAGCEVVQYADSDMVNFDSAKMEAVNVPGDTQGMSGKVLFWISPFLAMTEDEESHGEAAQDEDGDGGYGFLEKGKVVLVDDKRNAQ